MSDDEKIDNRVRSMRKARGLTQANLGELLGVSRQTINAIENGRYEPGLRLAFDIARVFSARIEDIFRPTRRGAESPDWDAIMMVMPDEIAAGPVRLRPHRRSDLAAFQRFVTDPASTRFMAFTDEQKTPGGAAAMIDAVIASYETDTPILSLTIADGATDEYLGAAGGADTGNGAVEVFVTLLAEARGRGHARAAMETLMTHLFERCGAKVLHADTVRENDASVALFERLGFEKEGDVVREATEGPFAHRDMSGVRYVMTRANYDRRARR